MKRPRIQEIASQLHEAEQDAEEAQRKFIEIDEIYQNEQQAIIRSKQDLQLEELASAEFTQLQQNWLSTTQQLASAQAQFIRSDSTWNRIGMPVCEFEMNGTTIKLCLVDNELCQNIEQLTTELIQKNTYSQIFQKLQSYQPKVHEIENSENRWNTLHAQYEQRNRSDGANPGSLD